MYTQLVERNIELLPFKKILSVSTMTYKGDGNGAAEESLSSYKRLRVGDIAFEGHTSKDFRYGRFVLNDTGDGIMSPRFSALRPISGMPIKFWKYYIHYEPIMKKILVNSTKSGTMMNELVVEEFLKEILLVPEEHEQQKIGRFFNGLDHLITLHQSKSFGHILEAIVSCTLSWEQRKWIDVVDISKDMVDPRNGKYDNLPHISPGNIESFTGQLYDNVKCVKDENLISGKFKFGSGDIIYGKINPQLGKYLYATFSGLTSADAYVLNAKNNVTQKYLYTIIQTRNFFEYSISVSMRSGMPKINRDELNAYSFFAPLTEEQLKIGNGILKYDHLITLHQLEPFQLIFKAIAYRIIDYAKSKPPRRRK